MDATAIATWVLAIVTLLSAGFVVWQLIDGTRARVGPRLASILKNYRTHIDWIRAEGKPSNFMIELESLVQDWGEVEPQGRADVPATTVALDTQS